MLCSHFFPLNIQHISPCTPLYCIPALCMARNSRAFSTLHAGRWIPHRSPAALPWDLSQHEKPKGNFLQIEWNNKERDGVAFDRPLCFFYGNICLHWHNTQSCDNITFHLTEATLPTSLTIPWFSSLFFWCDRQRYSWISVYLPFSFIRFHF